MAKLFFKNLAGTSKLDIQHWIALWEDGNGLKIQLGTYIYRIDAMTIDEFHAACRAPRMTNCRFKYVQSSLSCGKCKGKTRLDWVENTTGAKILTEPRTIVVEYMRNAWGRIKLFSMMGEVHHMSAPKIIPGHHLCNECYGTGIRRYRDAIPQLLEYKPKEGTPWDQNVIDVGRMEQ